MLVLPPSPKHQPNMWTAWVTAYNCQLCEKVFFPKSAVCLQSHIFATKRPRDKIKYFLKTPFLSRFFIFYYFLNLNQDFKANLRCKSCVQLPIWWKNVFCSNFEVSYLCNETSDRQNKIFLKNAISSRKCDVIAASRADFSTHSMWLGGGGEGGLVIGWPRIKRSLQSHVGGGGQYKMYKSIIFIILISRSKKVKPKMLTCVWRLCSASKLLRLWHFVSVLTYKFWISWRGGTARTLKSVGRKRMDRIEGTWRLNGA